MAKLVGGPLGSYRGKAGGTIGTSWKGIPVVKAMPLSVANPDTVGQQNQRGKFAQCVAVARLLLSDLITPYWNPFAKRMSGYNAFIKQNIDCFDKDGLVSPDEFFATRGILKGVEGLNATYSSNPRGICIEFDDNSGEGDALETDLIAMLYWNKEKNYWRYFTANSRGDGISLIEDNNLQTGNHIHVWVWFYRSDMSKISDSSYGTFTCS